MATTIVYAGTADDTAGGGHATYASVVATYVTNDGKLWTGQLLDSGTYYIDQSFLAFDASSIADTDTVSDVLLELWGNTNLSTTDFTVEVAAYDWGTSVTTGDFRTAAQLSALTVLATYATSGFSTGAYKAFTSTGSFPAAISLTGETRLVAFSAENRTGSAPADYEEVVWTSANAVGTTNDPKLTITHAAGTTTGTGAISVPAPTVSGTGTVTITGTGAIAVPAPTVAGSGTETFTATGAISVPAPTVAGSGTETFTATGTITAPAPTVSGTGTETFTATGAITVPAGTVSGTGTETFTATGAISVASAVVSGTGVLTITATGAISVSPPTVSGSGTSSAGNVTIESIAPRIVQVSSDGARVTATGDGAPRIVSVGDRPPRPVEVH